MKRWRKVTAIVLTAAMVISSGTTFTFSANAKETDDLSQTKAEGEKPLKLWYSKPGNVRGQWVDEALPLGNGNLGGMVFGGIGEERIHFNEKSLWTGGPSSSRPNYQFGNKAVPVTASEIQSYQNILDDKSSKVFDMGSYSVGGGNIPFGGENHNKGSYQDFGDIWLDFTPGGIDDKNTTNYYRDLDLRTGIASTRFTSKGVSYTREHFVSSPDGVMVTSLSASDAGKLSFDAKLELNNGNLAGTKEMKQEKNVCVIDGYVKDNGLKFRTAMQIVPEGGTIEIDEAKQVYKIRNADKVLIILGGDTNYKNDYPVYRDTKKDLAKEVDQKVENCGKKTYAELRQAHINDYSSLFGRVELNLGSGEPQIPTNELMDQYRSGDYSTYLEELSFQYGRYLSITGSRGKLPSNLVGLWTIGEAAWTGDYHFNVNVQMNYWPVYVTNLAECGETFIDYMESLREPGRLTAERQHGVVDAVKKHNGFTVHTENNPFGMTAPSNPQEYAWNPTGAAWAIQNVYDYYRFTGDKEYLKNVIYPIMKEAAMFWDNTLYQSTYQKIEDPQSPYNGQSRLVASPSFSAEQGPTVAGSTYDQSLIWELYKECIEAAEVVGEKDQAQIDTWKNNIQKLDPINVNQTNGIKEWYEETRVGLVNGHFRSFAQAGSLPEIQVPNTGWNIGHPGNQRHSSHLVGLYPGTLINKDNKEYMDAAIQSMDERGFYSTGWSKANKVNLWARTGNGNNALTTLRNLIGGKSSGLQHNLFDSHGSGGGDTMMEGGSVVWQIDGNYGLTAGVAEMLIQSQLGYTQFLPAVPDAWRDGEANGLKARGNFTVDQKWENGLARQFTVEYTGEEASSSFTGQYEQITDAKITADGKEISVTQNEEEQKITFNAVKGVVYTIDMSGLNKDSLTEEGNALLLGLDKDLQILKNELSAALNANPLDADKLSEVIRKGTVISRSYTKVKEFSDDVYLLTTQNGLTRREIDQAYVKLRQAKRHLLDNSETLENYLKEEMDLQQIQKLVKDGTASSEVIFSKKSGGVTEDSKTLTLSKKVGAPDKAVIRYTLDGSEPLKSSPIYDQEIQLSTSENTTVRAALFWNDQRVSRIFSEKYSVEVIKIVSADSNTQNWGADYGVDKLFDGLANTRWAAKSPSGDVEITLVLDKKTYIDTLRFQQYVSNRNSSDQFVIQYFDGEKFQTAYEGSKLGSLSDCEGNPGSEGNAIKSFSFPRVETNKVKIIIKTYVGEPSFWEIEALDLEDTGKEPAGDKTGLESAIQKAEDIDPEDPLYTEADPDLRQAFDEAILDCRQASEDPQALMDSKEYLLMSLYRRLGFGEADKNELKAVLQQAEELSEDVIYSKDSRYLLRKKIVDANAVLASEQSKQPDVDLQVQILEEACKNLESLESTTEISASEGEQNGSQWMSADTGYYYNTVPDGEKLSYHFSGNGIKVISVKFTDHGILRAIIDGPGGYHETIEADCYGTPRDDAYQVINKQGLAQGDYTISFQHAGGRGKYVEVGKLIVSGKREEPLVDRTKLKEELDKCGKLDPDSYTEESFKKLQTAMGTAQKIFEKQEAQTCSLEIQEALENLQSVREALVRLSVDKTRLQTLIDSAGEYQKLHYTPESFQIFEQALEKANEINENAEASQKKVDQAVSELESAVNGLIPDTEAPSAPGQITVEDVDLTTGTAVLRWDASVDNVEVEKYQISLEGTILETQKTSFSLSGLVIDHTYSVSISAVDFAGNISAASIFEFNTIEECTCQITDLNLQNRLIDLQGQSSVTEELTASANLSGACKRPGHSETMIKYEYSIISDSTGTAELQGATLKVSQKGQIQIRILASAEGTNARAEEAATIDVTDSTVIPVKYCTVNLNPAGGKLSYYSLKIESGKPFGKLPVPVRAGYQFTGWYNGSVRINENTLCSKDANLTARWQIQKPAQVTGLKAVSQGTSTISLKWNKAKDASGYCVYRKTKTSDNWKLVKTTTQTSYKNTGLKSASAYQYKVRSYFKAGADKSYGSDSKGLNTSTVPAKPVMLPVQQGGTGKAILKWKKTTRASGYVFYMKKGKGSYQKVTSKSSRVTKYVKTKLRKGTKYTFRMKAYVINSKKKFYSQYSRTKSISF